MKGVSWKVNPPFTELDIARREFNSANGPREEVSSLRPGEGGFDVLEGGS